MSHFRLECREKRSLSSDIRRIDESEWRGYLGHSHIARGGRKGTDEFIDHRFVERMRVFAVVRFSHVARRVHAIPEVDAAPASPAVRDLADHRDIVLMHRVAELLEMRDHAVVEQLDAIPIPRRARGMDARGPEAHHESDTAARLLFVIAALDSSLVWTAYSDDRRDTMMR